MAAHLDAGSWAPADIEKNDDLANEAQAHLERVINTLSPAHEDWVRILLGRLVMHLPDRQRPEDAQAMVFDDYLRILKFPVDIWEIAYDEALRRFKWFPTIHELNAIMGPLLTRRRRDRVRLEFIARLARKPAPVIPPKDGRRTGRLTKIGDFWSRVRAAINEKGAR